MADTDVVSRLDHQRQDGRILRVRPHPLAASVVAEVLHEHDEEHIVEAEGPSQTQDAPPSTTAAEPLVEEPTKLAAQDGGYGWVVVFGCFLMHVVNVGLIKSFGIIFVVLRENLHASNYDAAWIYSLFLVCSTWFAPLASFLANAFTQRSVVMLGGLLLGLGISLSYFADSLMFLYFSYGCLSGFGSALCYTPSVVAVGSYFEKRRALANGISLSGAALGSITVPYLTSYLVDKFDAPGALLICGAIALNVCLAGALLRPITIHLQIIRAQERRNQLNALRRLHQAGEATSANFKAFSAPASARSNGLNSLYDRDSFEAHGNLLETPLQDDRKKSAHSMPDEALNSVRLQQHSKDPTPTPPSKRPPFWRRFRDRFRRKEGQPPLFDFRLFRMRLFIVYASSVMLATFAYMNIFLILPAHVVDLGYPKSHGANLVALIGLADFFARIGFGWFSDLKLFHRKWGFSGAILCASLCNFLVPLATTDIGLSIYAAFLGVTSGSYISLVAVVCVDFFGIERLSSALGSVIAFQGAAFLAGPPLIGRIRDITGSYRPGFYALGVCLFCAALLIVIEHFWEKLTSRRKRRLPDPESSHELAELKLHVSNSVSIPLINNPGSSHDRTAPPIAHMDEFDPLTPRPVSKPVFKPKLKRRVVKEQVNPRDTAESNH